MSTRHQLTLFVPTALAAAIESSRKVMDPIQHGLIAAHVTFAREDELAQIGAYELRRRLEALQSEELVLAFGPPQAFGGHGFLLPCSEGEPSFHALRTEVLGPAARGRPTPHITLAHPRNPRAAGNTPTELARAPQSTVLAFVSIFKIKQEHSLAWQIFAEYPLRGMPTMAV